MLKYRLTLASSEICRFHVLSDERMKINFCLAKQILKTSTKIGFFFFALYLCVILYEQTHLSIPTFCFIFLNLYFGNYFLKKLHERLLLSVKERTKNWDKSEWWNLISVYLYFNGCFEMFKEVTVFMEF